LRASPYAATATRSSRAAVCFYADRRCYWVEQLDAIMRIDVTWNFSAAAEALAPLALLDPVVVDAPGEVVVLLPAPPALLDASEPVTST